MNTKYIYIMLVSLLTVSCSTSVNKGESFDKKMTLDFGGHTSEDDKLSFTIDKSVDLSVQFSKGRFSDNTYAITTKEYQKDNAPVLISLSSENEGTYEFSMQLDEATEGMEVNFSTDEKMLKIPSLKVREKWKQYIIPLIILLAIVIGLVFWLLLKVREKARPKFDNGYIQISYPRDEQVDLEGKHKIDIAKLLQFEDLGCIIYCERSSSFDEEEYAEKMPSIQVDEDMQISVNNKVIGSYIAKLSFGDSVAIKDNENVKIIELTINE